MKRNSTFVYKLILCAIGALPLSSLAQITTPAVLTCNVTLTTLAPFITYSGVVYQWSTSDGNIVSNPNATCIIVDKPGKYFLTTSDAAGFPISIDSAIVKADYQQPVAKVLLSGFLIQGDTAFTASLLGGDVNLSNINTPYGASYGLDWEWYGPNGFYANIKDTTITNAGTYTLVLTELRNGCKDTAEIHIPMFGILPFKFLSFDAVAVDNKSVKLNWETDYEQNTSHFEVERAFDMISFQTIGIALDGVSFGTQKSYLYNDNSPELKGKTLVYYRLKQIGMDGKVTYSKVLAVRLDSKTGAVMQVFPNPMIENLTVRFNSAENGLAEIRILNTAGQTILSKRSVIAEGFNNLQLDGLNKLNNGLYIAQLIMNGVVTGTQKVIKN